MKISINDNRKIAAIQEEFNQLFPYLKMEFFRRQHLLNCPTAKRFMQSNERTIGESRTVHAKGCLEIIPNMTVAALEQCFRQVYGLNVQVFRKSGRVWLETTVTDGWTLTEQNRQGETLSKLVA